jgi:hypothetical protein
MVNQPYRYQYETVAASQTNQVLGGTGATGDYIHRVIISVNTAVSGTVTLSDSTGTITLSPANTPIGVYSVELNMASVSGGWNITTGAGANCTAAGIFSA